MTQGMMQGPLDRPVPQLTERHWWHRLGDIMTILRRMDQRAQDANNFKLAVDEKVGPVTTSSITVPCQTVNPTVITGFYACISPVQTGTLQIADSTFTLNGGPIFVTGLSIIRREKIDSVLTTSPAAALTLEVMGYEQPRMAI